MNKLLIGGGLAVAAWALFAWSGMGHHPLPFVVAFAGAIVAILGGVAELARVSRLRREREFGIRG
jgi:hypothetical protein